VGNKYNACPYCVAFIKENLEWPCSTCAYQFPTAFVTSQFDKEAIIDEFMDDDTEELWEPEANYDIRKKTINPAYQREQWNIARIRKSQ